MLYIEKLNQLTKEKRFSIAIAEKIIRNEVTEEEAKRVDYLCDSLNDILHDMDVDSEQMDYCHSSTWVSGDFTDFLDFIVDEKITQKEFKLMKL